MEKIELLSKLREIHTLLTRSMLARHGNPKREDSDELVNEAEEKLNDLEHEIAIEKE